MTKHTPGPWIIMNPNDSGKMKYLVGSDGQGFAHTVGLREPKDSANARLIAAAPDLLQALKELLAVSWGSNSDKRGAEKRAEKVIAKAEGKDHD